MVNLEMKPKPNRHTQHGCDKMNNIFSNSIRIIPLILTYNQCPWLKEVEFEDVKINQLKLKQLKKTTELYWNTLYFLEQITTTPTLPLITLHYPFHKNFLLVNFFVSHFAIPRFENHYAVITFVWSIFGMHSLVFLQGEIGGERFSTYRAVKRTFSRVNAYVFVQLGLCLERLLAIHALERALVGVHSLVTNQRSLHVKSFIAALALKQRWHLLFVSCVD